MNEAIHSIFSREKRVRVCVRVCVRVRVRVRVRVPARVRTCFTYTKLFGYVINIIQ